MELKNYVVDNNKLFIFSSRIDHMRIKFLIKNSTTDVNWRHSVLFRIFPSFSEMEMYILEESLIDNNKLMCIRVGNWFNVWYIVSICVNVVMFKNEMISSMKVAIEQYFEIRDCSKMTPAIRGEEEYGKHVMLMV